jgi:hypothetical protein
VRICVSGQYHAQKIGRFAAGKGVRFRVDVNSRDCRQIVLRVRLAFVQARMFHLWRVPHGIRLTFIETGFVEKGGEGEGGLS